MQTESPTLRQPHQSRRSHPKSRTGCGTCKKRKIKCDEGRPACRNCVKHAVKCDFIDFEAVERLRVPTPRQNNGLLSPDLSMLDLELLHNYTISTYATLSNDPLLRQLWRVTVPQIGLGCDYVMRSVLAVSALHIAFHRPDDRELYISKALLYHQLASRKAMSLMAEVNLETAENLYLFSILTIYVALASPRKPDGFLLIGESSCPEWMPLLRGTKSLLALIGDKAENGPLSGFFIRGKERWLAMHPEMVPGYKPVASTDPPLLEELQILLEKAVTDTEALRIYNFAVNELRRSLRLLHVSSQVDIMDAFVWVWEVADEFLQLLEEPTQEAVAIFAHFCVLLKRLENQWWLQSWADHLMSRVYDILDDQHKLWIHWPMEQIGWVVP